MAQAINIELTTVAITSALVITARLSVSLVDAPDALPSDGASALSGKGKEAFARRRKLFFQGAHFRRPSSQ